MDKATPKALYFDSIVDMARYLDETPRIEGCNTWSTNHQSKRESPHSWEDAMAIARDGGWWPEGAEQIVQGTVDATALRENMQDPVIQNDVAGFMPDVPAYLAGVPDCMYRYDEGEMTTATMPTISIGVGTFSHGVDSQSVFNRGVAILSLIDAVEAVGYRVQLDFVGDNIGSGGLMKVRTVLKKPQDHWSPGVVAFATANASMLRRLLVGCIERDAVAEPRTHSGYGRGDDGFIEEYSLAFGYMTHNRGYETLEQALRTVEDMARDFGMDVDLLGAAREAA